MNSNNINYYIGKIAGVNFYNQEHRIIRVYIETDVNNVAYYDMYYMNDAVFPNPEHHIAIISTTEATLSNRKYQIYASEPEYKLPPGLDKDGNVSRLCNGYVWVVDKKTKISTTYHNHGDAGLFNKQSSSPSDVTTMRYSLTPTLNRKFSDLKEGDVDDNYSNVGVFIMDDSVLIKGPTSSIHLGDEGILINGLTHNTKSRGTSGILMENPMSTFFPSTLFTIPLGISHLPNFNYFIGIGTAVQIAAKGIQAGMQVIDIGSKISSIAGGI